MPLFIVLALLHCLGLPKQCGIEIIRAEICAFFHVVVNHVQ